MISKTEYIRLEARKELARRNFYDYCQLKYPKHYSNDRIYLKELCDQLQNFVEVSDKHFLIVTIPPRHYKSFTGTNFVEWYFGKRPDRKVMTGSYNETLSTTFARKVRDTIDERPTEGGKLIYNDIFPDTRIKYGQASASLWALLGSGQDNYLATSPGGTATGFGANVILIDDIIKNDQEAYNELVLDKHWDWFNNTMMQRLEGADFKVVVIMTRWATTDLAGRILEEFEGDVEHISYKAVQDDHSMLCEDILSYASYLTKTRNMNPDIIEANYNQQPIDVKGRLYSDFIVYDTLPQGIHKKWNYTDTADKGADFLCSVDYLEVDKEVYVTDIVMSDDAMEVTEPLVAEMLFTDEVDEAVIESNNGGRGYARNLGRLLLETHNSNRCVIVDKPQTANKEARILSSSAWVQRHVYFPHNWKNRWPVFHKQVMSYQRKGKNVHDDGVDVLAGIYENVTNGGKSMLEYYKSMADNIPVKTA